MEPTSSPRENILKGKSKIKKLTLNMQLPLIKTLNWHLNQEDIHILLNNDRPFLSINNVIKYLFFDEPIWKLLLVDEHGCCTNLIFTDYLFTVGMMANCVFTLCWQCWYCWYCVQCMANGNG